MTDKELADKLEQHQRWRRGDLEEMPMSAKTLGEVIDETIKRLRDEKRPIKGSLVEYLNDIQKEMLYVLSCIKGRLIRCLCEKCISCDVERQIDEILNKIEGKKGLVK